MAVPPPAEDGEVMFALPTEEGGGDAEAQVAANARASLSNEGGGVAPPLLGEGEAAPAKVALRPAHLAATGAGSMPAHLLEK